MQKNVKFHLDLHCSLIGAMYIVYTLVGAAVD